MDSIRQMAEAARRSREKKKNAANAPKPTKVITDDDLKRSFQPGQEGLNVGAAPQLETTAPSQQAVAAAEVGDKAAGKEAADQDPEIEALKVQIADAEKDLDLSQRQLALDQDSYLSNPANANDTAGKAKLDNEKQQIESEQQTVERLKLRLAALEELKSQRKTTRKAAAPKPPAAETPKQADNPPATPPQP